MQLLDQIFRLRDQQSSVGVEMRSGVVTFLTLSYILFVNPQMLSQTGMPASDVVFATAIASAAATLVMGLWANYPIALAPGMGLNAYFTFGVVQSMGVDWHVALTAVFLEGLLFLVLALTGIRRALLQAIPAPVKIATMSGIGLFLAMIGLQNAGVIRDHPDTLVTLGDITGSAALLSLIGLVLITTLLSRGVKGAVLAGIVTISAAAWLLGVAPPPSALVTWPSLPRETLLALDFHGLLTGKLIGVIVAFLFVDFFDTAGTLIGVGRLAGFVDEQGNLPRANRAFAADAIGTMMGALVGTSTVTSYVESATGVEEGGRTGLTAVTVAVLFCLSLFLTPIFVAVPAMATAPALIVVGALMMRGTRDLDWTSIDEAVPAFLTLSVMPLTFSIANGISFGIVAFVAIKLLAGRWRDIHPLMLILAIALIAFHALH